MEYLIYISTASKLLDDEELTRILNVSRKNNQENQLTGILLYSQGTFIQFLEGPAAQLNATFEKIIHDDRHRNVIRLTQETITERCFADWTMGFRRLKAGQQQKLEGYFDPRNMVFNKSDHPGVAIIKTFAEDNCNEYI